ncbi:RHS repeat-associated core domain-containing protein [Spirochaeta cellobiosiphila]|uniref:RHS repeat-associated core domain-containing protein n=1 Tax=Spirochaeta cellobiosiphila TaxID=504483 RepID=UPI0012EC13A7
MNNETQYTYDAFGQAINGSFVGQNQMGYNGKRVDSFTGKYDYGFRDYDPMRMRWTTIDPIKDGANWYVYVGNDPINFIDLWGLDTLTTYNKDPTPGSDIIVDEYGNPGHTWICIDTDEDDDKWFG